MIRPGRVAPLAALALLAGGCPSTTPDPETATRPPPGPPIEADEIEDFAREMLDDVARIRNLPLGDPPEVRILPLGAFMAVRVMVPSEISAVTKPRVPPAVMPGKSV